MDGFLDDEEDPQLKRRMLSGDLEPISTGLCWEDSTGVSKLNDGSGAISTEFKDFKMEFLLGKLAHTSRSLVLTSCQNRILSPSIPSPQLTGHHLHLWSLQPLLQQVRPPLRMVSCNLRRGCRWHSGQ